MDDTWTAQLLGTDSGALVDDDLAAMLAAATGPVDWSTVASGDAERLWTQLREWVEWFRREFAYDHRVVPPCWYLHPALVSVLSALRDHWSCAYDPVNTPVGASEWHRVLIQLEPRLRDWSSGTGCTVGAHRPDVIAAYPDDTATWKAHTTADIAARKGREVTSGDAADPAAGANP